MDENMRRLKSKAKLSYELGRVMQALSWLKYPILLILVTYGFSGWSADSRYLSASILVLSFFGVWYGQEFEQGVKHGLTIGSLGLWMPVLAKLMQSLPHGYHSFLCIILGMGMSMGLWHYLIQSDGAYKLNVRYLIACCITSAATASLCCPSIGVGSVGGIFLGVLSLSTTHFLSKLFSK